MPAASSASTPANSAWTQKKSSVNSNPRRNRRTPFWICARKCSKPFPPALRNRCLPPGDWASGFWPSPACLFSASSESRCTAYGPSNHRKILRTSLPLGRLKNRNLPPPPPRLPPMVSSNPQFRSNPGILPLPLPFRWFSLPTTLPRNPPPPSS